MNLMDARDQAMELVQEGIIDAKDMLLMALKYMSNDDVADMLEANEIGPFELNYMEDEDE